MGAQYPPAKELAGSCMIDGERGMAAWHCGIQERDIDSQSPESMDFCIDPFNRGPVAGLRSEKRLLLPSAGAISLIVFTRLLL